MPPETKYVRSGDVSIAYQVLGDGPFDVVLVPGFVSHVELGLSTPPYDTIRTRLASYSRLLVFDKRGTGMSDRPNGPATLETRMDDVRAVMDAAGSTQAALVGISEGAPMSLLFAATYPERTWGLVLLGSYARELWAPDYPWAPTEEQYWKETEGSRATLFGPREQAVKEITEWLGGFEREAEQLTDYFRQSASPGTVEALDRMNKDIDVRPVLPAIRASTLLVHGTDDHIPVDGARWIASRIPAARLVELPGARHVYFGEPLATACDAIEGFLNEVWETAGRDEAEPDRLLATVLFTDIVGSSEKAACLGDRGWRELLERHHELVRRQLVRFRGKEVDTAGDGFFASFDGPARAIRCACTIAESMNDLALDVRFGLHTGECELVDGKVAGIAVHTGARVAAMAASGEVLVSSTVKDLVAGSGLQFNDRGTHQLKGIPGEWHLYSVAH